MPDLDFKIAGAEPIPNAVAPTLAFKLHVTQKPPIVEIHSVALRCQLRLEPGRRRYSQQEQERLVDLFGEPHRWGQTVRSMLWTHASLMLPGFDEDLQTDLPIPCTFDFNVTATKYFDALGDGVVPTSFLFNGTIFYAGDHGLQVHQISWEKQANYPFPVSAWKRMMDMYYPNSAWLRLPRDLMQRLAQFRSRCGFTGLEQTLDRLLDESEQPIEP